LDGKASKKVRKALGSEDRSYKVLVQTLDKLDKYERNLEYLKNKRLN